jgi:hypothetical protein
MDSFTNYFRFRTFIQRRQYLVSVAELREKYCVNSGENVIRNLYIDIDVSEFYKLKNRKKVILEVEFPLKG